MAKNISNALAVLGILIVTVAIVGRFYGAPTVFGHCAISLFIVANTCLLISIVINGLKK